MRRFSLEILKKLKMKNVIFILLCLPLTIAVIVTICIMACDKQSESSKQQIYTPKISRQQADQIIDAQIRELLSSGAVHSINVEFNQVRIAPELWRQLPIESKQGFVYQFSKYFDSKGSMGRVTILSSRSDKKLATYGSWRGMRILE